MKKDAIVKKYLLNIVQNKILQLIFYKKKNIIN